MKTTSIIIAAYNEPGLYQMIQNIFSTTTKDDQASFEVIVVDDNSFHTNIVSKDNRIRYIRNDNNLGVGASFDVGVQNAKGNRIMIMGADIRFTDNEWYPRMLKYSIDNPMSIICTDCVGINPDNMDMSNPTLTHRFGADIIFEVTRKDMPKFKRAEFPDDWYSILHAKWRRNNKSKIDTLIEVPSVYGACYITTKPMYETIRGWKGFTKYGGLEQMFSLKTWLSGGSCLCATDITTYHIFNRNPNDVRFSCYHLKNKIFICRTILGEYGKYLEEKYAEKVDDNFPYRLACAMLEEDKTIVSSEAKYNSRIFCRDIPWFVNKFNLH